MQKWKPIRRRLCLLGVGTVVVSGCMGRHVAVPAGYVPPPSAVPDFQTSTTLGPHSPTDQNPDPRPRLGIHSNLPGAGTEDIKPPKLDPKTPISDREKAVRSAFPQSSTIQPTGVVTAAVEGHGMSLADLQQLAAENSPVLRRAVADSQAAYGSMVQAGLYPNPTIGYQSDQVQPWLRTPPDARGNGAGQQGGFLNQLIKTAGKLTLAQKVAGFDYLNSLVAVRRAQVDVAAKVRAQFFAVLVAEESVKVSRAMAELADEVYGIQLKQVAAGEAAAYEPLQVFAQAEQARNAVTIAEQNYRAAWRQLASAVGRPDLPPTPLTGQVEAAPPRFDADALAARVLEQHTEILTAKNTLAQAEVNLTLQKRLPIPDISTNQYHEFDNLAQTYQFGLQIGIELPVADRNQGNIRKATATIVRAHEDLRATQNDLLGRLAEAYARYESNRVVSERYRGKIIPNLTRAYRAIVKRYQVEPEKVGFNEVVVAQQILGQGLQSYLTSLDAQWRAVVEVANLGQLDELYPAPAAVPVPEVAPPPGK